MPNFISTAAIESSFPGRIEKQVVDWHVHLNNDSIEQRNSTPWTRALDELSRERHIKCDPSPKMLELTRIRAKFDETADVAIDLPNITANDIIVRSSSGRKHGIYSGATGIPETVYVGKTSGTVAYNKVSPSASGPHACASNDD